jgi:hypothetical protein
MRRRVALGIGLTLAMASAVSPASVAGPEAKAQPAAVNFYAAYLKMRPTGIPSAKERAQLRALISPALDALLKEAALAEARHQKKTKGKEPPLVEGDIFTSMFEGADVATVIACEEAPPRATCKVELRYLDKDAPMPKPVTWTDEVFLLRAPQGWSVDDIAYGGDWPFGHAGQRLISLLDDVAKEARDEK